MVPYVLPLAMVEVREYLDQRGQSPFAAWSDRLNREAAAKVATGLFRPLSTIGIIKHRLYKSSYLCDTTLAMEMKTGLEVEKCLPALCEIASWQG
jgi:hypothetical protein